MTDHQLINQSSMDCEYYTPPEIVEAVHLTMGGIDLDPASSSLANRIVRAKRFLTIADDAMTCDWTCERMFMNHPFGRAETACNPCGPECPRHFDSQGKKKAHVCHDFDLYGNTAWIRRLIEGYTNGRITQACSLTFPATSEAWFQPLSDYPQCYLSPRTNYLLPNGKIKKGVTKGSVVTYLGMNVDAFAQAFQSLGKVKIPYGFSL